MCSSWSVANETLGGQVHFPRLPFLPGLRCRLHWAHLVPRVKTGTSIRNHSEVLFSKTITSAHPSPCCCCSMITASSEFPSPVMCTYDTTNKFRFVNRLRCLLRKALLKLIQSNCLSYQNPKYNPPIPL